LGIFERQLSVVTSEKKYAADKLEIFSILSSAGSLKVVDDRHD
jgi:hypothetical protein